MSGAQFFETPQAAALAGWDAVSQARVLNTRYLNDAKAERGSRLDRHQLIGEGRIGPGPFKRIMTDPRFRSVPMIIETPKDDEDRNDRRAIRLLRKLRSEDRGARSGNGGSRN